MVFVSLNTVIQILGALLDFQIALKNLLVFPPFYCVVWFRFVDQGSILLSLSLIGS